MEEDENLWCATVLDQTGEIQQWGYCKEDCVPGHSEDHENHESVSCDQCLFPFSYKDVEHNSCTMEDDENLWCATEVGQTGEIHQWGYCREHCYSVSGHSGNHEDHDTVSCDQCQFPFGYKGVDHNSCTMEDEEYLWCATELDENGGIQQWGWCSGNCTSVSGHSGNHEDHKAVTCDQCQFPFGYKGVDHNSCTMEDEEYLWCATELDENGGIQQWGWCSRNCTLDEQEDGTVGCDQCQFPFSYNGTEYHSCTEDYEDHLWCATELNEIGEMTDYGWCREMCLPEEEAHHILTVSCDQCLFPFSYKGVEYNSCTMEDEEYLWCATELDENGGIKQWGWCSENCGQPK